MMDKLVEQGDERSTGSLAEFEQEWRGALDDQSSRYLGYPSLETKRQSDFFEWVKAQQILEILKASQLKHGNALEYGCGSAGISLFLAGQGFDCHICDLSLDALRVAQRNQQLHNTAVDFRSRVNTNVLSLPYADAAFDLVMSYGLLEHFEMEALHRLLDETLRVLKPGGLFLADIIPGPERWNVRTLGIMASYLGSASHKLMTGRWSQVPGLHQKYFEHYFETTYDDRTWARILGEHGLENVQVWVCRPFPPLALPERWEKHYTNLMRCMLTLHERFDQANNWFTRRWGWMYLASGYKKKLC